MILPVSGPPSGGSRLLPRDMAKIGRLMLEKPAHATFTLKLGKKDIELAREAAGDTAVPMPLADLMLAQHAAAIARGFGDRDWASLGNYIAECAGLPSGS